MTIKPLTIELIFLFYSRGVNLFTKFTKVIAIIVIVAVFTKIIVLTCVYP